MADCGLCWTEQCTCEEEYNDLSIEQLTDLICKLMKLKDEKIIEQIKLEIEERTGC